MEAFHEQLYKRKTCFTDILMRIIIISAALAISAAVFIEARKYLGNLGRILGVLGVAAIVFAAYKAVIRFNVEFEYTYFGGEIDIDKIMDQTARKRIVTVDIKSISDFGEYTETAEKRLEERIFDTKIDVRSRRKDAEVYYAVFKHKSQGNTLLLFEPDKITLTEMCKVKKDLIK